MFLSYLNDRKSWLAFYFISLGIINFVLWIDQGIQAELSSVLYINLLLITSFILFFMWRYFQETKFIKALADLLKTEEDDWHVALPNAVDRQDEMTKALLQKASLHFANRLEKVKNVNLRESDYMAAWVHEVKTPLTAMKLTIDAHRSDPDFRKIETEWVRLHLLIERQLSIARLSTLEKTTIKKMVSAEIKELASWFMEKNIAVEFKGEDQNVIADVKWSRFMIRQFLTNAIKYSPVGGVITIIMQGNISLQILDEGAGIAPHDLPRIFEKGFTGGAGRIHNAASGLGLYLARIVADKTGMTLTATSELGKGTTIEILFPNENDYDRTISHPNTPK